MMRLTWLQYRLQLIIAGGALVVFVIVLAFTGYHLGQIYDTGLASCQPQPAAGCAGGWKQLFGAYPTLQRYLGYLGFVVPLVIGVFWGAPLISRELETGTFRISWTQSVSRRRWLASRLGAMGLVSVLAAGLVSLMVTWWFTPIDTVLMNRFSPGIFDQRGIVGIGYAVFAFVLGATAGLISRRAIAAMAITLVVCIVVRIGVPLWVRPHYVAPVHQKVALTPANVGLISGYDGSSQQAPKLIAFVPAIPNAWVYSETLPIVDAEGRAITRAALASICPELKSWNPSPSSGSGDSFTALTQRCVPKVAQTYHGVVTYQPGDRFWLFQCIETALFTMLALLLAAFSFWWIRYRLA